MKTRKLTWTPSAKEFTRSKGLGTSEKNDSGKWFRPDEINQLMDSAREGDETFAQDAYDAFFLTINLGLRASECVDCRIEDFRYAASNNSIEVRARKKGKRLSISKLQLAKMTVKQIVELQQKILEERSKPRKPKIVTVYIGEAEKPPFLSLIERRRGLCSKSGHLFPFSKRYLQYLFSYYQRKSGIRKELSPHALRRFCSTRITKITGNERLASKRLRHSEPVTRGSYIEFSPEQQIELLAKLEAVT